MGSASLLLHREAPAAVLVYGHSVTTLAAALAAAEHGIPLIHVGAGQCPKDMSSPEGRHAELTDRLSSLLCCLDPADEQGLHARQMERGTCVTAIPSMICSSRTDPACSPLRRQSVMEQPSGNSSFAIFPGRRPSAAPTASAPCWKDCRSCTPGRSVPSCWCSIRLPLPVSRSGSNRSRTVSASCRL